MPDTPKKQTCNKQFDLFLFVDSFPLTIWLSIIFSERYTLLCPIRLHISSLGTLNIAIFNHRKKQTVRRQL